MLHGVHLKPITGTFMNLLISDTGIGNFGKAEWERAFRFLPAIGMDTVILIRTEVEQQGVHLSAEDPRSTTWPEDENLLDMAFRLADENGLSVYLGGPQNITNLHLGDWRREVDANRRYYDRTMEKYSIHPCLKGCYVTLEALPWHFNFLDICREVLVYLRQSFPTMKTLLSPGFSNLRGDMRSHYSVAEWLDIYGRYFFSEVAGLLDYCAPQDGIAAPACELGRIQDNGLARWYVAAGELLRKHGIGLWSNVETFQRPFPGHGEPAGVFRQADYRTLYMKLAEASPLVDKIITYEYFSCFCPDTEWGSARRLLARYLEMIGRSPDIIQEYYPG